MKKLIISIVILMSLTSVYGFSAQTLLEAASGVVAANGKEFSAQDEKNALQFIAFMSGFTCGINTSGMIDLEKKQPESSKVIFPAPWMKKASVVAPSLIAFIQKNKPANIPLKHLSGHSFYTAWYLANHPDSSGFMRERGYKIILDQEFEKGGTFKP